METSLEGSWRKSESVRGQKLVMGAVRAAGGAHLVPVTTRMLSAVKNAASKKTEHLKKQNEKKRKAAEDMEVEQQAKKRKQEED
jgi:hypothetical protein